VHVVASLGSGGQAEDAIGLLDIGTSKTVCVIVAVPRSRGTASRAASGAQVLGCGVQPSRGVRDALVVELDEAEHAVRAAVAQAERAAGVTVEEVSVAVACGQLASSRFTANTRIEGRVVGDADMQRMMAGARTYAERGGRTLLHMNCLSYRLDGATGIADPHGLAGQALAADLHAVTVDEAPLSNLLHVIERAYLTPVAVVPAPYASALASTTATERQQGVIALDIGAGATTLAVFCAGHLVANDVLPIGGSHITFDIARALSTPAFEAERIKKEYGTLAKAAADDGEVVLHALASGRSPALSQTTRGQIRQIVGSRMLDLFGRVAESLGRLDVAHDAVQRMVLTGGASQPAGLGELAADFFARPVRIARTAPLDGMPAGCNGPAFATAIGLVRVALDPSAGVRRDGRAREASGYLRRMGQWLRESF
jgi:cell division protein FtsA